MNLTILKQNHKALIYLSLFHILVICSSNYLVQIPFTIFGYHTTWGAFTFPFIFLSTDLTIRLFGASLARKIIFVVMIPALILSYIISVLFSKGSFSSFDALNTLNTSVFRITIASMSAYIIGQLMDISVFNYLRKNKAWWVAPSAAAIVGNLVDTFAFFGIAFYQSENPFMASNWVEIAIVDYGFKLLICGLFFLPLYGALLNFISKLLAQKQVTR